jgi:osmotically-inducible protein OsmY
MITDVNHSTSDVELERRILNYLRQRIGNLRDLEIEARDGRVIVRGTVPFSSIRRRLIDCSRSVAGVLHVIDRLEVNDSAAEPRLAGNKPR